VGPRRFRKSFYISDNLASSQPDRLKIIDSSEDLNLAAINDKEGITRFPRSIKDFPFGQVTDP
jgi:hypothetical protein